MSGEDFERFGRNFKNRVIYACVTDYEFFQKIFPICKTQYFGDGVHYILFENIKKYFEDFRALPTFDTLKIDISKIEDEDLRGNCKTTLVDIQKQVNQKELEHTKQNAFEFCSEKEMEFAI